MRACVIDLPGLSQRLLDRLPRDRRPAWLNALIERGQARIRPILPAVTMPMQATLTTGATPEQHGVIANGFAGFRDPAMRDHFDLDSWPEYRRHVSFWEQSNALLQTPRIWQKPALSAHPSPISKPHKPALSESSSLPLKSRKPALSESSSLPLKSHKPALSESSSEERDRPRVALLFCQSSIGAADVIVTPKPEHTPDGRTIPETLTEPAALNVRLKRDLGPFPLHRFWGPGANLESSRWIADAARIVWAEQSPDLMLTYIPHLDYDQQRLGPSDPKNIEALAAVLDMLTPLVEQVTGDEARVLVLSEYGITDVSRVLAPNQLLHEAGLLSVTGQGELDRPASRCFVMCDHQIAHLYGSDEPAANAALDVLADQPEIASVYRGDDRAAIGLNTPRAGDAVLLAAEDAWFEYRWWRDPADAPGWAWTVDIHRKPGYDPTEMFYDPRAQRIRADAAREIRGSHGVIPADTADWPVLIGAATSEPIIDATDVAGLLL